MKHKHTERRRFRVTVLTGLLAATALGLSGCYVYDDNYGHGHRGSFPYFDPSYRHHGHPPHGKLKPKEKAHYYKGRHFGHPHGGPPGQMKKHWY